MLKLPDHERARRISDFYRDQDIREAPVDLDQSAHARAVVLGELREQELRGRDLDRLVSERSPSLLR